MPLRRFSFIVTGSGPGAGYAGDLLARLGADVIRVGRGPVPELETRVRRWTEPPEGLERLPVAAAIDQGAVLPAHAPFPIVAMAPDGNPVTDWAASGVMALTGDPGGDPLASPGFQAAYLRGASAVLAALSTLAGGPTASGPTATGPTATGPTATGPTATAALDGPALPGERAAIARLHRQGRTSVGGASRLMRARDGWVAVTLARPTDFEALPAWLGAALPAGDPWAAVEAGVAARDADDAVESAQLLGIAVSAVPSRPEPGQPWSFETTSPGGGRPLGRSSAFLVVDLSALWAGPLATSFLVPLGVRVIKVESATRPDGARRGPPEFFDLLNGGKESVLLDLDRPDGRADLRRLIDAADVVVEAGRPRVMRNWGIDVEEIVSDRRNLTWVSLTGYGRDGASAGRVAFGDDAAAGAGLVACASDGDPRFCGDAYADPVTGLHAAIAITAGLVGGGAHLVDVSLTGVCRHLLTGAACAASPAPPHLAIAEPRARRPTQPGPALGTDTERVLAEIR